MSLLASSWMVPSSPEVRRWNEIIKKHMLMGNTEQAFLAYINMQVLGFHADNYTFPILLKTAGNSSASRNGFALHGQTVKTGFHEHIFVQTALINMYGSLGWAADAWKVFEKMPVKDLVAWNSMLDGFASNGEMEEAINLFHLMPLKDLSSFNIMISGYSSCGEVASARNIFDKMAAKDIVSWNSMLYGYARAGDMEKGFAFFKEMPIKNIISWNTMITVCLQTEHFNEALDLFDQIKTTNCLPDYLTITSVLSACARLGSLEIGAKTHLLAISRGIASIPHVTTALIDMYAKCGSIEQALLIFLKSPVKDIFCWNAMISGLALHGHGYGALKLFNEMRKQNQTPDDITFIALLNACSHSGLVEKGFEIFKSMMQEFGISPKLEHYGCLVDLLCRAGHIDSAFHVAEAMPFEPGESIFGALLSSCVIHQNLEIGERVIKMVSSRAPYISDGELMMFANLYASCGKWEEAKKWREMMNNSGIVKTAGFSEIEVDGKFQKFLAGK